MRWMIVAALALVACQDYNFTPENQIFGEPNPPDLSTPVKVDRIVQVTVPAVDVLWVIDNSGSMMDEQTELRTRFDSFINYFIGSGLDWHVGVVSTDMSDPDHRGKLRLQDGVRYLDPSSPHPADTFRRMADLGTSGDATEKGRAAAWSALVTLRDGPNAGFYRDDAFLSVIVISDEDDSSGSSPVSKGEFISWLQTHKPREGMTSFSSIVGSVDGRASDCTSSFGDAWAGYEYVDVTDAVGGIVWSICSENWDPVLDELGMQAAGLKREFFLSEVPVEDSVHVWVEQAGATIEEDWTYSRSRNSITFVDFVPDELAEVFIEYEVLSGWQPGGSDEGDTAAE